MLLNPSRPNRRRGVEEVEAFTEIDDRSYYAWFALTLSASAHLLRSPLRRGSGRFPEVNAVPEPIVIVFARGEMLASRNYSFRQRLIAAVETKDECWQARIDH